MVFFSKFFAENEIAGRSIMLIFFTTIVLFIAAVVLLFVLLHVIRKNKYLSEKDGLTKLYNFVGFCNKAEELLKKKKNNYFIVVGKMNLIDIYIQTNGIEAYEQLLGILGDEASRVVKENEIAGRISEKNFGLLLIAENESSLIERLNKINVGERMLITFRYGVYDINKDGILSVRLMIDKASYFAPKKEDSLNVEIGFYDNNKYEEMLDDRSLLSSASSAFMHKDFKAYFQPQYDTFSEKIVGAEALVRWIKNDGTIIPPIKFIKLFESNGLIEQLDFEVFEQACCFLKNLQKEKMELFPIAVNFSRAHLFDVNFVSKLLEITNRYDISTELLEIELTESSFNIDNDLITRLIGELHKEGFKISIDDFGSEYSSLNVLKDVNADLIKIDMCFLNNFKANPKSGIILNSIVRMAKWLGVPIIAEGVDGIEELEFLRSIGCDYIQGYYYSKPISSSDFFDKLKENDCVERKEVVSFEKGDIAQIFGGNFLLSKMLNCLNVACAIAEYFRDNLEIIRVNVEYERIFNINSAYSLNLRNVFELIHPDDLQSVKDTCDILVKTNVPRKITFRRRVIDEEERQRKNIDYLTIEATVFVLFSNSKRNILCFSMKDDTDKHIYKTQLNEAKKQLEALFENAPCPVILRELTESGEIILKYANKKYLQMLKCDNPNDIDKYLETHESYKNGVERLIKETVEKGSSRLDFSFISSDNVDVKIESYTTLLRNEETNNPLVLIFLIDKTIDYEYKNAQKRLNSLYVAFDFVGIINNTDEKMDILFDRKYENQTISKMMQESFLTYLPFVDFYYETKKKMNDKDFNQAEKEFVIDLINGKKMHIEMCISKYDENSLIVCARDITLEKKAEINEAREKSFITFLAKYNFEYVILINAYDRTYSFVGDTTKILGDKVDLSYDEAVEVLANKLIREEERNDYRNKANLDVVLENVKQNGSYSYDYLATYQGTTKKRTADFRVYDSYAMVILMTIR